MSVVVTETENKFVLSEDDIQPIPWVKTTMISNRGRKAANVLTYSTYQNQLYKNLRFDAFSALPK